MGDAWHRIGNVVGSEVTPPGRNRTCNSVLDQPLRPSTEADAMANRERNVLVHAYAASETDDWNTFVSTTALCRIANWR